MQSEQKMSDDQPPKEVLTKISARYVSYSHTTFAYCAFFFALIVASYTHYYKIVKNEYYGYPEEWFPSVSAATGDWYPARAIFHIFIALTSGPRFALVYLWYLLITSAARPTASRTFSLVLLGVGLMRTVACGGWVYITSSDDHTMHDIAMLSYLVLTIPWMFGVLATSPRSAVEGLKYRRYACWAFFGAILPMVYFFVEHKVHKVAGAYTNYAFFEWQLILYDVAFDAVTAFEFANFQIAVLDVSGVVVASKAAAARLAGYPNPVTASEPVSQVSETWRLVGDIGAFVADLYLAFVFWSMLTSLALLIWYFPLWHMGISGYEAFLLVTISPLLLGSRTICSTVYSYRGYFHLLSLVGIASWVIVDPAARLATTATGISLSILTWTATWASEKGRMGTLEYSALVWILGLLLHTVIKMAWWTENPIWPIMHRENGGKNLEGLLLAIIACVNVIWRDPATTGPRSSDDQGQSKSAKPEGSWPMAAVGFGSLLFALHSMYSDSSTIMRWVVDGYPDYGPSPVPWGVVTIVALALGVILSASRSLTSSLPWFVVGSAGCAVFYAFSSWTGYFGGLVLATYLTSITPLLIRTVTAHPPGRTLFVATMTYNILCLAHVWVVAYAFVPGGVYARERTNWVLSTVMLFIGAGVYNASGMNINAKPVQLNVIRQARQFARVAVVAILALAAVVAVTRMRTAKVPKPWRPELKVFTAAIWTIHFALDNDMWASERRMRDVFRDLELDVVGLLESDTMRIIMGNRDWAQYIAEDMGYYLDYGPATMKHTWGCLMLSKFPILRSSHHLLPSPNGELACAIHATLDIYGQPVDFIVSHNGQEEDELDRRLQTTELARIMRTSPNPFVFLGYVVTKPNGPIYKILFEEGDMNDIDPSDWDRWCEYVGFRGLRRVAYARVSHGEITDTEIQTGKFQVVPDPAKYWKAEYDMIQEWNMPNALRYPPNFRLPGVRNHHYHVFEGPRYWGPVGADWLQVYASFKVDEE